MSMIDSERTTLSSDAIFNTKVSPTETMSIGVLKGEGIGPEVIEATLQVLRALESIFPYQFELEYGDIIGRQAMEANGEALSISVIKFCHDIFQKNGAILCGPGGDRFVYDLRKQFDLFCKIVPLKSSNEIGLSGRLKQEYTKDVDIILLRDNAAGIYQGNWGVVDCQENGRIAEHSFSYPEKVITRLINVAVKIAEQRKGEITVVVKDSGVPSISKLWRDCATDVAISHGIRCHFGNVDYVAYQLIQHAQDLDVLVTPNLFGDILGDIGALLMGSRAVPCSGNFSAEGAAVYQTCHGTGYDLVNTDLANPVAQIFSLAMLLRESFGLDHAAHLIEGAVREVWRQGFRTFDLMHEAYSQIGTKEMGNRVAEELIKKNPF